MIKNGIVLLDEKNQPIGVFEIKTFKDEKALSDLKEKARMNALNLILERNLVVKKLDNAEKRINRLEAQIKYDHGEIDAKQLEKILKENQ